MSPISELLTMLPENCQDTVDNATGDYRDVIAEEAMEYIQSLERFMQRDKEIIGTYVNQVKQLQARLLAKETQIYRLDSRVIDLENQVGWANE